MPSNYSRRSIFALALLVLLVLPASLACSDSPKSAARPASDQTTGQTAAATPIAARPATAAAPPPAASQPRAERTASLTLVGQLTPGDQGFNADVWGHNGFAYVGTWGTGGVCPATGIKIVDLADPAEPRWVSTAAAIRGTSQEDMVVRSVATAAFQGDLLAVGIQQCAAGNGAFAGLALYDVTDPRNPVQLALLPTGGRGVHELDMVQQGDRVLALLAVPDTEVRSGVGDFRIVDVSDPRRPVQTAAWGVGAGIGADLHGGIGCQHRIYDHSARASADGRLAYLSYWDAGVIVLDIGDPSSPRVAGQIRYPPGEQGTTHSVSEADGGSLLLTADEEGIFAGPPGITFQVQTASGARGVHGCEAIGSYPLDNLGRIDAELVDGGRACSAAVLPDVGGRAVLVEEGGCGFADKAAVLARAGARLMLLSQDGGPLSDPIASARLPVIGIAAEDGAQLKAALTGGPLPLALPTERAWGGLRIWDISDLQHPRQVGSFQTPNSLAFPVPGPGFYTIHNPEADGDVALLSWYSDGVRVLDIADPAHPHELAAFVPPATPNPQAAVFPNAPLVWGVHVLGDLVLASDINGGLYILRLTVDQGRGAG